MPVDTTVPPSAAVFELEEDESGAFLDRGSGAEQRGDEPQAAQQERMPIWVIPLLAAAVRFRPPAPCGEPVILSCIRRTVDNLSTCAGSLV